MDLKRILAATDGSRDGEHAVAVACTLAEHARGEFSRIEVQTAVPAWEPQLDRWTHCTVPSGTVNTLRGLPGVEIVRQAETWGADLVVLGRHQRNGHGPVRLGETSDTVIRRRNGLTLFAPPGTHRLERGLIALDGSIRGLGVLSPAAAFLEIARAKGQAICVLPGSESEAGEAGWRDSRIERIQALIQQVHPACSACELLVRWGDPVQRILEAIEAMRVDVLMLGVRRGGAAGDLGSGHIGRDLLQAAPCAVLTVPI